MWAQDKKNGFTIVELLIVIVVIAILAAVSIVAYNGIQQRARNSQTITTAQQWKKLIMLYVTQNGGYGAIRNSAHYCLGTGNPTDWDANPDEDCVKTTGIKHMNAALNAQLATIGTLPKATPMITTGGMSYSGVSLRQVDILDPTGANIADYPTLWYYLEGTNQDCVLRPVVKAISGGITIDTAASSTVNDGTTTVCRVALSDPTVAY